MTDNGLSGIDLRCAGHATRHGATITGSRFAVSLRLSATVEGDESAFVDVEQGVSTFP